MAPLGSKQDLSDEDKSLLEFIAGRKGAAEKLHRQYRPRWDIFYGLHRNYRKLRRGHSDAANQRDRDEVLREFQRIFGTEMFIPYCFATIETVVPRVISQNPRMIVRANRPEAEEHVKPMEQRFEYDQAEIDYDLTIQKVVRSGLKYGLGVQKTFWERDVRMGPYNTRGRLNRKKVVTKQGTTIIREGPQAEWVDIYDWFWDPAASSVKTMGYAIHRTWRTQEYVAARSGNEWAELDLEKVKGLRRKGGDDAVWAGRRESLNLADAGVSRNLHEVWEYHDGPRVVTVLDSELIVQGGEEDRKKGKDRNPFFHGEMPFQTYRPTLQEGEMVGIGEIEPIAHLQFELNEMRGQRRKAATLALNRGYFYQDGFLDPAEAMTGSDVFVPVTGDPRESIYAMPFEDLPASSVSEEQALKNDIELTSGITDTVAGTAPQTSSTTATGTQLVQAAANVRINQKSKNLSQELLRPAARQWKSLYAQKTLKPRTMRVPNPDEASGYGFIDFTPQTAQADLEVIPEWGSQEADNKAQKKVDAITLGQFLATLPNLDAQQVAVWVLKQWDVPNPEKWIKEVPAPAPAGGVDLEAVGIELQKQLVRDGLNSDMAKQAVLAAMTAATQGGPATAPTNGQTPQPAPAAGP